MAEEIIHPSKIEQSRTPIDSDIHRLAAEVAKHKENPEMSGASEHEVLKQAIRSISNAAAPAPAPRQSTVTDDSALPGYMANAAPAAKLEVEDLLRIAFKEGVIKATGVAQRSSPFVLDAFHDALAGKLHDEMKKRKLI